MATPFPVAEEYTRCVGALVRGGVLAPLPANGVPGVAGGDGHPYPLPSLDQVAALFAANAALVDEKTAQGFDRLELVPLAMPVAALAACLKAAIGKRAAEGTIHLTRSSPGDPPVPARVNATKHVWIWETLRDMLDTAGLVYFPQEPAADHRGRNKAETINDPRYCAFPGWSVGLVEHVSLLPRPGQGKTIGGRRQLEIGAAPRGYLGALRKPAYRGESGRTIEDFLVGFLCRLEACAEISHDRQDDNALWLLGQYLPQTPALKSGLVPTGWWHHDQGRLRLDAHRPDDAQCARSWGAATVVRLPGPAGG